MPPWTFRPRSPEERAIGAHREEAREHKLLLLLLAPTSGRAKFFVRRRRPRRQPACGPSSPRRRPPGPSLLPLPLSLSSFCSPVPSPLLSILPRPARPFGPPLRAAIVVVLGPSLSSQSRQKPDAMHSGTFFNAAPSFSGNHGPWTSL